MSNSQKNSFNQSQGDLLVIGDLCIDVDVFTGQGDYNSRRSSRISLSEGGSAGNVAFMANRLGLEIGLAAPLSDDAMGKLIESIIRQRHETINFYPITDPNQLTCFIVNLINKRGVRKAYFQKNEANCRLDSLQNVASNYKAIHMSGYVLEQFDISEIEKFVHEVKSHSVEVSLDLFPRIKSACESEPQIYRLLDQLDLLIGNIKEYRDLTGLSRSKDIMQFFTKRGMRIVIKMGSKGSIYADPTTLITSPPLRVKPVSLKGAGDVFIAGFLASHLKGSNIQEALKTANKLAGMHIAGKDDQISPIMINIQD